MQINEITPITTAISMLVMTSGTGISSSLVFAQNESEMDFDDLITDSNEDQVDITLTNGSEVQGNTSGLELPQQQPQGPLSPPLFNRAQSEIKQSEQCTAMVQSLIQRAQDAIDSGEYGQWRNGVVNEIQQLNRDCPEQMQGQQQ